MKLLFITNSLKRAIVDDEDYERCQYNSWSLNGQELAVGSCIKTRWVSLANFIMENYNVEYDHKDRNPLNNQKQNLRSCNHSQNSANKEKSKSKEYSSKYKGVNYYKRTGMWRAHITVWGKNIHLGYFYTDHEAALAYNKAALRHFKEFAVPNQINTEKEKTHAFIKINTCGYSQE